MSISRDEWLKALGDAGFSQEDDQSAVTLSEFAALVGISRHVAAARLGALIAAGKAIKTKKYWVNGRGIRVLGAAYKLTDQKKRR